MSGNILLFSEKNIICPEKFLYVCEDNDMSRKFFRCPFLSKSAPWNRPPPQIFDASYIPVIQADKGSQLWKTYHIVEHSFFPSYCTMKASKYVSVFFCVGVMYSGEYERDVTVSVYPHRASLKNMPIYSHGGNRTHDLWNTSPMLCQLSYAVRSVRLCDISELSLVTSISM